MTSRKSGTDFAARLEILRQDDDRRFDDAEVRSVLQEMLATMKNPGAQAAGSVVADVQALSAYIDRTRSDIAALQPVESAAARVATASDELDSVVAATEIATNAIMENAERIEAVAAGVGGDAGERLTAATLGIYEACSFQDITGQRIVRIVKALQVIDAKIDSMLRRLDDGSGPDVGPGRRVGRAANPVAGGPRESALLNGPQAPGTANSQDDIDALLANLD